MKKMLTRTAAQIIRSTSVKSVAVFQVVDDKKGGLDRLRTVVSVPRGSDKVMGCREKLVKLLDENANGVSGAVWCERSGVDLTNGVFSLPGFGFLCLSEPDGILSEFLWESFKEIAQQLSVACVGCYLQERLRLREEMDQMLLGHSAEMSSTNFRDFETSLEAILVDAQKLFGADRAMFVESDDDNSFRTSPVVGSCDGLPRTWMDSTISAMQPFVGDHGQPFFLEIDKVDQNAPLRMLFAAASAEVIGLCPVHNGSDMPASGFVVVVWRSGFRYEIADFNVLQSLGFFLWSAVSRFNQHKAITRYQRDLEKRSVEAEASASRARLASRTKSRSVAVVSHEVRTALSGMLSSLELVADSTLDESQRTRVMQAMRFTDHVSSIMDDVIDLAAIEEGKFTVFRTDVSVRECFRETIESMRDLAAQRGNRFVVKFGTDLPSSVKIDAVRSKQLVLNLVSNALKVVRDGLVEMFLGVGVVPGSNRKALIVRVEDNGPGFPEAFLPKACEPFVKFHHPDASPVAGAGLGLAIVSALTESLGGSIAIKNRSPTGASVSLWIPFESATTLPDPTGGWPGDISEFPQSAQVRDESSFAGKRILLVDDDDEVREAASDTLERIGCDVALAHDGEDAVEQVVANSFDLVLMDCRMPKMDGFEATRQIKSQLGEERSPPIIALTAAVMQDEAEICYEAGMDDILAKPYSRAKLRALLKYWLMT